MRERLRAACARLAGLEPVVVILAAPLLWFPELRPAWTAAALALLAAVWIVGWIGRGRPGTPTPLDAALLLVALAIPVGVWASGYPGETLPKLAGLILGLAAFRAVANAGRDPRALRRAAAIFLLLGLALAAVGLLGMWPANKLPALGAVLERVPRLVAGLPGAAKGVHPNELGGTVVLFLPVAAAAAVGWGAGGPGGGRARLRGPAVRGGALALALFLGAVLALSQSRSAWFGAAAGLGAVAWLRWPRARWLLLAAALLLVAGLLGAEARGTAPAGVLDLPSLADRLGPWSRGLDGLARFPLTGVGLGAFRQVAHLLGPASLPQATPDIAHAHNVWLQVGVDLGVAGLVGYVALVGGALWCCLRAARREGGPRWLAAGVVGALVAFHVFGIADTIAPGAKPGVALWMLFGLAAGLEPPGHEDAKAQRIL